MSGKKFASSIHKKSPVTPMMVSRMEKFRIVSVSVKPLILQMIQKELSFIQLNIFDPQPITMAMYTG